MKRRKKMVLIAAAAVVFCLILPGLVFAGGQKEEGGTAEKSEEKGVLSILCFQGYAEPDWVDDFEKEHNCEVKVTYAGTVEEHFTKTKMATDEYNIVSNDSGRVNMYYDAGLIQPIDVSKLKNYGKVGSYFADHSYAQPAGDGKKYHVPITWGPQTMSINMDNVSEEELAPYYDKAMGTVSYDVFTAPEFKGRTAFFDEAANVVPIAAIHLGMDTPFQFGGGDWDRVFDQLLKWKNNARTFTSGVDSEYGIMTNEDADIVFGGNTPILVSKLHEAGLEEKFGHFGPTEGAVTWIDGWVITTPTKGKSLDLALKYIDYMIGDEGQTKLAKLIGFGIVNPAGSDGYESYTLEECPWFDGSIDDVNYPLYIMVPEDDPGRRVELWNKVKATQ
jgi:spermidine/putrescine-binding protein